MMHHLAEKMNPLRSHFLRHVIQYPLGQVAVELAGRLMLKLGYDGIYLDKKSRDALINCLVLLIGSAKEKVVSSNAGIDRQNTGEEIA